MGTMASEQIKRTLERMIKASADGELDTYYHYLAGDYIFHRAPFPDVIGKDANRRADEAFFSAFTESQMTIHQITVQNEWAYLRYTWKAQHSGFLHSLGIPPTGKTIQINGCFVFRWMGDKIVEQWDYTDMLGLLQQVGVIPVLA